MKPDRVDESIDRESIARDSDALDGELTLRLRHRVLHTENALEPSNAALAGVIDGPAGVGIVLTAVVDQGVLDHWPDLPQQLRDYATTHRLPLSEDSPILAVPGGEFSKNIGSVLDDLLSHIHDARLCRHSTVLAIGGGAVLDVAGYAAAVAHRGVRLVRMPTTTLAQCDSGVGVKNGVNAFGQKNFVGTFSVPQAVVNDTRFLTTLSDRDWRAGFSEVVKVALLKDAELFAAITIGAEAVRRRDMEKSLPLLRRSAELHWRHIMECGDPFELTSARPLDYGHWSAHRLERLTDFALRHGEAVAIGVALDTVISSLEGRLTSEDCERTLSCLEALGFTLWHDALGDTGSLLEGLEEFREHLGGRLSITHLDAIGHSVTVDAINPQHVSAAVERLRLRHGREDVISQAI